jgi:hypothetical protein
MQWGSSRIVGSDGKRASYALGTFLSSIPRILDVEVIHDWNVGHGELWGKIGHFSSGYKACGRLAGKLSTLMKANQDLIGVDSATLADDGFKVDRANFVPLADVPDYKWTGARPGARPRTSSTSPTSTSRTSTAATRRTWPRASGRSSSTASPMRA